MKDDNRACHICGDPAAASVAQPGGIQVWYCLEHFCLHDLVCVGSVKQIEKGVGSFWGFKLHDLEGTAIATFAYMDREAANLAREAMSSLVVESAALISAS
jgi:hypothetical protein